MKTEKQYTVKKRFAYLPVLVWAVPAIDGEYYRFIFWKPFYTIQENGKWMYKHTYLNEDTAKARALNFNAGMVYDGRTFRFKD